MFADTVWGQPTEAPKAKDVDNDWKSRWGGDPLVTARGFTPVATTFLWYAAQLEPEPLTPVEMIFLLQLMTHRWRGKDKPYPGYKRLAQRMGISVVYARKLARSLEKKGVLIREERQGTSNRFNLQPLFEKLAAHTAGRQRGTASSPPPSIETSLVAATEVDFR